MPKTDDRFKKVAQLAHIDLEINNDTTMQLEKDVASIMDYIEQLRQVDTTNIKPLLHPLDLNQRLRTDQVMRENTVEELAKIAPLVVNDLFLVPQVINTGN